MRVFHRAVLGDEEGLSIVGFLACLPSPCEHSTSPSPPTPCFPSKDCSGVLTPKQLILNFPKTYFFGGVEGELLSPLGEWRDFVSLVTCFWEADNCLYTMHVGRPCSTGPIECVSFLPHIPLFLRHPPSQNTTMYSSSEWTITAYLLGSVFISPTENGIESLFELPKLSTEQD